MVSCHGNKKEVCCGHGEDKDDEEAVVATPNTAVQEQAVVVVIPHTHITQFAVFSMVRLEQLEKRGNSSEKHFLFEWLT